MTPITLEPLVRWAALLLTSATIGMSIASGAASCVRVRVAEGGRIDYTISVGAADVFVMVRGGTGSADLDCWLYDGAGRLVAEDVGTDGFCVLPAAGIGLHRVVARTLDSEGVEYVICTTSDVLDTRRDPPSVEGDRRSEPNAGEHQPSTGWSR